MAGTSQPESEEPMLRPVAFAKILLLIGLSASFLPLAAQSKTVISGVVKNASGEPVEGALIRVRNTEKGFTFMVASQAQGRYTTPNLLPGKYTVDAVGGDHQTSTPMPVNVAGGQPATADLAL